MSYHHHHHHHQSQSPPCCCSNTCICCSSSNCNCNCNCNCCCSNSTPNPISSTSDLLLQTLLLIQSQPQPQPQSQPPPRPIFLKPHPNKNPRHPLRSQPKPKQHDDDDDDAGHSLHLLHSLIRRVAALESSLSKISPPPPPPPQKQRPQPQQRGQSSLKHAAAATIQRCFRRFLVRRSSTLRHLNHLAYIKSQAAALTSSLSDNAHSNPKAISRRAMHLLSRLDSIQSSDPMIREGKRSVSKELVRISEFVDKVLLIREKKEDEVEELERSIDRARRVSFAATEENGDGDGNVFDDLLERNPEAEEEEEEEEEVQGANESLKVVRHYKFTNGGFRTTNGGLGLAAPLPVKMEPRRAASLKKVAIEED